VIWLLQQILCILESLALSVIGALILAFNAVVAALAALVEGLVLLMPPFPDLPSMPDEVEQVMGWVNWWFPVGTVIELLLWLFTVWLVWLGVSAALRWAKAIGD